MTTATQEELDRLTQLAELQARNVLQKLPLLGPVSWLMMQQSATRHLFIADLEWRVLPALILDQARLYMKDGVPVSYVSWALLSEEVAARYQATQRLAPADWRSGDQPWLVDVVVPFGNVAQTTDELRRSVFAGRTVRQLVPADNAGAVRVMEWPSVPA